jgi:cytochrome c556
MKLFMAGLTLFMATAAVRAAEDPPLILQTLMTQRIAPGADTLWAVGNRAMTDEGDVDATRLGPADWAELREAATDMKAAALAMGAAEHIEIVPAGTSLPDGSATASEIRAFIDRDPAAFSSASRDLAEVSEQFIVAAGTRDSAALGEASTRLNAVCEACHARFWYPES